MLFKTSLLVTFLAVSFATALINGVDVGASPQQTKEFEEDFIHYITKEIESPQYTAYVKEVRPYLPNEAAVSRDVYNELPHNVKDFKIFATHPLAYATDKPEPKFVQKMPPKVRKAYTSFVNNELKVVASLASKDLGLGKGAAPHVMPGLGWVLGAAAGAVGLAAVML